MGTKRVEGKKKRKSIKAKVTSSMGSKRRLAKFGKENKKGHKGEAANYITRSRCIKKLQITLKDFRRLCILKGIYPRDPKKKANGKDKVYYHVKDISYLAHEPLLEKFRNFKAFMKKVRRAAGRKDVAEARRLDAKKPTYELDHLIKERYPQFTDALGDLDDALCMIHLFAALPAEGRIKSERTANCLKLCREWQNYIARSHSLTKVFVSIKGIYYQANIMGQEITWLVPHAFPPTLPKDVDFRVMLTFLEFYECLIKFVNFKLYSDLGISYPPAIDLKLDAAGAQLASLKLEAISQAGAGGPDKEDEGPVTDKEDGNSHSSKPAVSAKKSKKLLKSLGTKLQEITEREEADDEDDLVFKEDEDDDEDDEDALREPLEAAFASNEEALTIRAQSEQLEGKAKLFRSLYFFLSREVPHGPLELVIRSLGGEVGWEGEGSPYSLKDSRITHQICDRPVQGHRYFGREYVQPQWIFDSANHSFLLPASLYEVGKPLPPHLSPFVDDEREGYTPDFKKEVAKMKNEAAGVFLPSSTEEQEEAGDEEDDAEEEEEGENEPVTEEEGGEEEEEEEEEEDTSQSEAEQKSKKKGGMDKKESKKPLSKAEKKDLQEREEHEMRVNMMNKKAKRLYGRMQHGIQKKQEKVAKLEEKRKRVEEERKGQGKKQRKA